MNFIKLDDNYVNLDNVIWIEFDAVWCKVFFAGLDPDDFLPVDISNKEALLNAIEVKAIEVENDSDDCVECMVGKVTKRIQERCDSCGFLLEYER